LGLDEDDDDETIDNGNGKPTTQVHSSTKATAPAKKKPATPPVNRIQAIMPDDRNKTDKNDSTNKKH
jgi:hypothetical protein